MGHAVKIPRTIDFFLYIYLTNGLILSVCYRHALVALSHFGSTPPEGTPHSHSPGIYQCIRYIVQNEGTKALFKGLGPNLVGVAPSRAIYFCAYSKSKIAFNAILTPDTPLVHVFSAFCAGEFIILPASYRLTHYQFIATASF